MQHAAQALQTIGIKTKKEAANTDIQQDESQIATPTNGSQQDHVEAILKQVADHFGIEVQAICGQGRTKEVSQARQVAMYLIKTKYARSLQRIGDYF